MLSLDGNAYAQFGISGLRIDGDRVYISRGRHRVEEAWCEEVDDVVDIDEAQAYCLDENAGKRMMFRCSDAACRALFNPEIIGVNYHVPPDDEHLAKMAPHFRWKAEDGHFVACRWITDYVVRALKAKRKCVSRNPNRNIILENVGDVIDEFLDERPERPQPPAEIFEPTSATGSPEDIKRAVEGRLTALTEGQISTCRLERIVRCFVALCEQGRQHDAKLTINGVTRSYISWFRGVEKFRENIGRRIYIGLMADLRRYDAGYWMQFKDCIDIAGESRPAHLWIPNEMLQRYRYRASLRDVLDRVCIAPRRVFAKCYFLGTFEVDDQGRAAASLSDLHHLFVSVRDRYRGA